MTCLIRTMTAADVAATAEAIRRADWGDRTAFLRFVVGHPACHPIVALDDEGVAGTGLGTVNGSVGWVGLIWVRPDVRGRGLGRALTERVVADLEAGGCPTQILVATEAGQGLYARLGFRELTRDHVLVAAGLPAADPADPWLRLARPADADAIETLDRQVSGEDRRHLLAAATDGWVAGRGDEVRAFALQAPAGGVGVVAPDPDDGLCLLTLRRRLVGPEGRARANVLEENRAGLERLVADGWREVWSGARMLRGAAPDWQPTAIWSVFGHAIG
ncbi:MAG TPA: GNAT family N-acetyltransferase [Candidatus Limnocylindrales bacterium]